MRRPQQVKSVACFDFRWRRREKGPGFRWEQHPVGDRILVGPPDESLREYEPLAEETGLFLNFARLEGKPDAFVKFANTYGRLGTYYAYGPERGEPLDEWQRHHRWMRFLVELRTKCLEDRPELGEVVQWQGDEILYLIPKIGTGATETWRHRGQLRHSPRNQRGQPLFHPGDLRGPALWFLAYAIEEWLVELDGYRKPITPRIIWSEDACRPQFVFAPSSLLGAMVCQFAVALHGAWPFKECAYCHRFFRLAPGVNRANRLTCSQTCKQYLHNSRVARARQLYSEGWTVRRIAKELRVKPHGDKSSVAVVQSWITRK
jgi:hypothetical protein